MNLREHKRTAQAARWVSADEINVVARYKQSHRGPEQRDSQLRTGKKRLRQAKVAAGSDARKCPSTLQIHTARCRRTKRPNVNNMEPTASAVAGPRSQ